MIKQIIVMRKDLNMRKGKMIAQGANASMKVILDEGSFYEQNRRVGFDLNLGRVDFGEGRVEMYEWLIGLSTKICVSVDSEHELFEVYNEAKESGLPCAMILDVGLTEFNGKETYTCCAIGPAKSEDIDKITGGLKLL